MKIAAAISSVMHGLILSYITGFQFQNQFLEDVEQISGPEVISLEEYCKISTNFCFVPETSKAIDPLISMDEEIDSKFFIEDGDMENLDRKNLSSLVEDKMQIVETPQIGELGSEDINEDIKQITDIKSIGNEEKLDIIVTSNEKPPPRNSQRIAKVASSYSDYQNDLSKKNLTSPTQTDATIVAKEEEGSTTENSSVEISLEGQEVEAILNAAPKLAQLPPSRPKNILGSNLEEVESVDYEGLISAALDDVLNRNKTSSINEVSRTSDSYTLFKVEQTVASFYNTAALSGLADPEQYKVRVKFFISSKGVSRESIQLLDPKNPTERHLLNLKYARNAIIKALSDKKNYISSEKYPSGINVILNFTPTLGVGYD